MKRISMFFAILVLCFFATGCATQRGWRYNAESKKSRKPLVDKTVAVPPFNDARPDNNKNSLMLSYIPLVFYGSCDYSVPETGGMKVNSTPIWLFKPTEDLAKAAAEELEASGIFREVFFTQRPSEGDLVFLGTIKSTRYKGTMITYGLSVYGIYLWILGIPAGDVYNEMAVDFELKDSSNNSIIWSRNFQKDYRKGFNLYSMPSDFTYDIMFKDILIKSTKEIEEKLSKYKEKNN